MAAAKPKPNFLQAVKKMLPLPGPLIYTLWVGGLILAMALLWQLTGNFRASRLMRRVNSVLIEMEVPWRLNGPLADGEARAAGTLSGVWFRVSRGGAETGERCLIFTMTDAGIGISCAALYTPGQGITEMLPLGVHGKAVFGRLSPLLVESCTRRIEEAAARPGGAHE